MAYSDKVIDHYENPRNVGSLPKDDVNVGTGLVGRALGLEPLVADGLAGGLLGLALDLLGLVLGLVGVTHCRSFPSWSCVPGPSAPAELV